MVKEWWLGWAMLLGETQLFCLWGDLRNIDDKKGEMYWEIAKARKKYNDPPI
jgi:hypothetical protein